MMVKMVKMMNDGEDEDNNNGDDEDGGREVEVV